MAQCSLMKLPDSGFVVNDSFVTSWRPVASAGTITAAALDSTSYAPGAPQAPSERAETNESVWMRFTGAPSGQAGVCQGCARDPLQPSRRPL
jgi:hypothetical protein